jgi:hypothetical protein
MAAMLAGTGLALGQGLAPPAAGPAPAGPGAAPATTSAPAKAMPPAPGDTTAPAPTTGPVSSSSPSVYMGPSHGDCGCGTSGCSTCGSGLGEGLGGALHGLFSGSDGGCDPEHYHIWGKAEYLLWRFGTSALPPLTANVPAGNVSFLSNTLTVDGTTGAITSTSTNTVTLPVSVQLSPSAPGGNSIPFGDQPGIRLTVGAWFDDEERCGFDASYFWLWRKTAGFSNTTQLPNQVVNTGVSQSTIITSPGGTTLAGQNLQPILVGANVADNLSASASNQVWGYEINGRTRAFYFGPVTVDILGGIRYVDLDQKLLVNANVNLTPLSPALTLNQGTLTPVVGAYVPGIATVAAPGFFYTSTDIVDAHNRFYGAQIGTAMNWRLGYGIYVDGYGKLAFGDMHQDFSAIGSATINTPGQTVTSILLGTPGTAFTVTRDRFSLIPELNLNLGYEFSPALRVWVGYNAIYFTSVAKVANQFVTSNTTSTITFGSNTASSQAVVPGFKASSTDSTLQGWQIGAELRF